MAITRRQTAVGILAVAISVFGASGATRAQGIAVNSLPKIVRDMSKEIDVETTFVVNVERQWISPRLRARAFRGKLSELLSVPKDALVVDDCIVYDSVLLRFHPDGGALQFSRFKKGWLAATGGSEAYVIIFELDGDLPPDTRFLKVKQTAIESYFTNGYEIEVRPKAGAAGVSSPGVGVPSGSPPASAASPSGPGGPQHEDFTKRAKGAPCVVDVKQVGLDVIQIVSTQPCGGAGS